MTISATETLAGSNVYNALSSTDRTPKSLTPSESKPILRTRLKNKTSTREKLQSKLNLLWPLLLNGSAIDVKRRNTIEKTKPMMSCSSEPGRMYARKPTRNICER